MKEAIALKRSATTSCYESFLYNTTAITANAILNWMV